MSSNNDQVIKKTDGGTSDWSECREQRAERRATKADTERALDDLYPPKIVASCDQSLDEFATPASLPMSLTATTILETEIAKLQNQLRRSKREIKHWQKRYRVARDQWYQRCNESWTSRNLPTPPAIEEMLKRIEQEWKEQQGESIDE